MMEKTNVFIKCLSVYSGPVKHLKILLCAHLTLKYQNLLIETQNITEYSFLVNLGNTISVQKIKIGIPFMDCGPLFHPMALLRVTNFNRLPIPLTAQSQIDDSNFALA
jgi:hypothetical protein